MSYLEIKVLLQICSDHLYAKGCDPQVDAVDMALEALESAKIDGMIE